MQAVGEHSTRTREADARVRLYLANELEGPPTIPRAGARGRLRERNFTPARRPFAEKVASRWQTHFFFMSLKSA
jgi:hypothetical protein